MKKIIFIFITCILLIMPVRTSKGQEIIIPEPGGGLSGIFCNNSSGGMSSYINGVEHPWNVQSDTGVASDQRDNIPNPVDSGRVTFRLMKGRPDIALWQLDDQIVRVLIYVGKRTNIFWRSPEDSLDKAKFFTIPPANSSDPLLQWASNTEYFLENTSPLMATVPCPKQQSGAKRGASAEAVTACQDKWLNAPLMSTDQGKVILEAGYQKLNEFWSQGSGHNLFTPGKGGIITADEDQRMYNTFFSQANLESTSTDTYRLATSYNNAVETQVLSTLNSLGIGRDKIDACGKGVMASIGAYAGMGEDVPAPIKQCLLVPLGAAQGGVEAIIRALSNKDITLTMAKQLHAFTYLKRYIDYRQCLAEHDPTLKNTVAKEVANYNALNTIRNQQLQEAANADRNAGQDWVTNAINWIKCKLRNIFIVVLQWEANAMGWLLRRNY